MILYGVRRLAGAFLQASLLAPQDLPRFIEYSIGTENYVDRS